MKILEANLDLKLDTLRRNPYFDDLPEELLKEITAHMQLRGFDRGEILFWEDDPCAGLHIIEQGSIKLYRIRPRDDSILSACFRRERLVTKCQLLTAGPTLSM
jgi:CRP-like cAMP-binding protein